MATIYDTIAVIVDKARDHANEAREDRHPATMVLAIHELAAAVSNLAELSEKHESRLAAAEDRLSPPDGTANGDLEAEYERAVKTICDGSDAHVDNLKRIAELESQLKNRRQLVDSYALEMESILQTVEGTGVKRDPAYPPSGHVAELATRYEKLEAERHSLDCANDQLLETLRRVLDEGSLSDEGAQAVQKAIDNFATDGRLGARNVSDLWGKIDELLKLANEALFSLRLWHGAVDCDGCDDCQSLMPRLEAALATEKVKAMTAASEGRVSDGKG